jgi:glycosyltransferase involved in cell wall biosynthesis
MKMDLFSDGVIEENKIQRISLPERCSTFSSLPLQPKVAILLCTKQGERFLPSQLESFTTQTHTNWELWASDDASNDQTKKILLKFQKKIGSNGVFVIDGPDEGFCKNFLSLACNADISADFYAYSDQDDIWEVDKLQRAVDCLQAVPSGVPALYCSRTLLVDAKNSEIGFSPLFEKEPCFANALMQNIGGGNTMVFNQAATELLKKAGPTQGVVSHDWWTYILVSGCGGKVFYDDFQSIRYRQHDRNLVGMNSTWTARFARIRMMFQGQYRDWNNSNIQALQSLHGHLTCANQEILDRFSEARNLNLISRLIGLKRSGIYRQTLFGNLGLIAAAILKKI